jgi:hypothetical protein
MWAYDFTHWGGVTRTRLDLFTVRDREIWNSGTKIDEVVSGGQ